MDERLLNARETRGLRAGVPLLLPTEETLGARLVVPAPGVNGAAGERCKSNVASSEMRSALLLDVRRARTGISLFPRTGVL